MLKLFFLLFICFTSFKSFSSDLKSTVLSVSKVEKEVENFNANQNLIGACNDSKENICEIFSTLKDMDVPSLPLKHALLYYIQNKDSFKNQRYISIADYSQVSTDKRFYLIDLENITVSRFKVSHGSGSINNIKYGDINHDGFIDKCEHNGSRTNMTRPGFFKTAELYLSHGSKSSHLEKKDARGEVVKGWPYLDSKKENNALRLDGLSYGINDRARASGVVMHGAWYNNVNVTKTEIMGRSYGCPAFSTIAAKRVLPFIKGGSLFYSYVPICKKDHDKILNDLAGLDQFCSEY